MDSATFPTSIPASTTAGLLPASGDRAVLLEQVGSALNAFWDCVPELPIGPASDGPARAAWLERFDFSKPVDLQELASSVIEELGRGTLLTQHPRYFGLFNPAPSFAGILGDLIVAAINPQIAAASHAPLAAEIERHVIASICARLGWGNAGGHFTTGGAEANMTALLLALTAAEPGFAETGSTAFSGPPAMYASRESHLAWFKIAHQLGIGRAAVRLVPTDGTGRMSAEALRGMIADDIRNGLRPVLVAATAGTTGAGMVDPLADCASAALEHGLWFHVDAAWAGALIASERLRGSLVGIEAAHSVTIDAHKWFSVPMGAGMFLTRRPEALSEAFRVSTSYMPAPSDMDDPYTHSCQWSRRFIGLKFFMTLAAIGWDGYAAQVERQVALAERLREMIEERDWRIENASPAAVLCFTDARGADPAAIVDIVQRRQNAWISVAELEGRKVLRACITSFRTTACDIDGLVEELGQARELLNP